MHCFVFLPIFWIAEKVLRGVYSLLYQVLREKATDRASSPSSCMSWKTLTSLINES